MPLHDNKNKIEEGWYLGWRVRNWKTPVNDSMDLESAAVALYDVFRGGVYTTAGEHSLRRLLEYGTLAEP